MADVFTAELAPKQGGVGENLEWSDPGLLSPGGDTGVVVVDETLWC